MNRRRLPAARRLIARFSYDPITGSLVRNATGKSAYAKHSQGYWQTQIDGEQFLSHRIIWKMMTGKEPPPELDHIDGDRSNNRWGNLRPDNGIGNRRNKKLTRQNRSGLKGACFCRYTGRWKATIKAGHKQVWLGRFDTAEAAHSAYCAAARRLHGQFANDGRNVLA